MSSFLPLFGDESHNLAEFDTVNPIYVLLLASSNRT
jgi:hypothetical protein